MVLNKIKPIWSITKEWEGYSIDVCLPFSQVDPQEYLGIYFSCGRPPKYIRKNKDLVNIKKYFFNHNKSIPTVFHAVEIPAYTDCVRGRLMETVPKCQFDLEGCEGIFVNEPCVIDGDMALGRTYHDHGNYMGAWIQTL